MSVRRPAHHTIVLPVSSDTVPLAASSCTGRPEIVFIDMRVMQTGSYPAINSSPYMTPALSPMMQTTGPMLRLPTNTCTSGLTQTSAFVPASSNQALWSDQSFTPISCNSASHLSIVTSSAASTTWSHIRCRNNHLPVGSFTGSVPVSSCAVYAGNSSCTSMRVCTTSWPCWFSYSPTYRFCTCDSKPVLSETDTSTTHYYFRILWSDRSYCVECSHRYSTAIANHCGATGIKRQKLEESSKLWHHPLTPAI